MISTRNTLNKLAQALAALIVFVAGVECALRVAGIGFPPRTQPDAVLGVLHRPGATFWQHEEGDSYVQINSEGFRDIEWPVEKHAGEFRIAVLGDSYVESMQVPIEQRFTELLAEDLTHEKPFAGQTVRVMNFGMAGYGTGQELLLLRDRVAKYHPDLVVLGFLTANDLSDNCRALRDHNQRPFFVLNNGELRLDDSFARSSSWKDRIVRAIADDSRIVQIAYEARRTLRSLRGRNASAPDAKQNSVPEWGLDDLIYLPPATPSWHEAWEITEQLLLAVNEEALAMGATLLVVTLTNPDQMHPDPAARAAYMNHVGAKYLSYPDDRVERFCEEHGIAVEKLVPAMLAYAQANHVFLHGFENTKMGRGHWNQAGHRLVAELIAKKITAMRTQATQREETQQSARDGL
ncbi:MAG TPA: SGNH/GDSL hydrolase family protein [Pirellulales bacterium]